MGDGSRLQATDSCLSTEGLWELPGPVGLCLLGPQGD